MLPSPFCSVRDRRKTPQAESGDEGANRHAPKFNVSNFWRRKKFSRSRVSSFRRVDREKSAASDASAFPCVASADSAYSRHVFVQILPLDCRLAVQWNPDHERGA
jgi:hypothetical protein